MLILKTDINNSDDFSTVRNRLDDSYRINECTIDLEDKDKVVRIIGDDIEVKDVVGSIKSFGFLCEELPD